MIFKSAHPDIHPPTHLTVWEYLFEDPQHSTFLQLPPTSKVSGYTNALTHERVSFSQVKSAAEAISTALVYDHGFRSGDSVVLFGHNTVWYPVTLLAAIRVGGRVCGASPAYNVEEMTFALRTADARVLFTVPESMEVAVQAARNAGIPQTSIFLLEGHGRVEGYASVHDLIAAGEAYQKQSGAMTPYYTLPSGTPNTSICAFLCFSSGTTGLPKAVQLSHQNIIAQTMQLRTINPEGGHRRIIAVLPLFHITGLMRFCITPVSDNAEVFLLPKFDLATMLDTISKNKIEEVKGVPPIMIRMVRDPIVDSYDLSCVKRFASGAAPMSDEIIGALAHKFPGRGFLQGYGMTESTAVIAAHPPSMYDFKFGAAAGTVVANTEVKIIPVDDDNSNTDGVKVKELGINQPGEILARGPQIAYLGYLNNPLATAEAFDSDGFLHTGDIGRVDELGLLHVLDRRKELIKVKGVGVAPAELEDFLLGHPEVEDCAVVGVFDEYSGERPRAWVVPADVKYRQFLSSRSAGGGDNTQNLNREVVSDVTDKTNNQDVVSDVSHNPPDQKIVSVSTLQDLGVRLLTYVRDHKVRHKALVAVEFVEGIPKSASGKILRRVLKDAHLKNRSGGVVVMEDKIKVLKAKL